MNIKNKCEYIKYIKKEKIYAEYKNINVRGAYTSRYR